MEKFEVETTAELLVDTLSEEELEQVVGGLLSLELLSLRL